MQAKININEFVWVELTDWGWEAIRKHYEEFFSCVTDQNFVEASVALHQNNTGPRCVDGEIKQLTRFQLWQFMQIFGKHCEIGISPQFAELNTLYLSFE